MSFKNVVKLTSEQYNTLLSGVTVQGHTLNQLENLYLVNEECILISGPSYVYSSTITLTRKISDFKYLMILACGNSSSFQVSTYGQGFAFVPTCFIGNVSCQINIHGGRYTTTSVWRIRKNSETQIELSNENGSNDFKFCVYGVNA